MRSHRTVCRPPVSRPAHAQHRDRRRGFTLIEIVIVLAILGILASMAVYTYRMMINKARMTQAKTVLDHLVKTQAVYFGEHEVYTDCVVLLDFDPVRYPFYLISVVLDNDAKNFTGIATGTGIMEGDRWTITKDGQPRQADNSVFR